MAGPFVFLGDAWGTKQRESAVVLCYARARARVAVC